MFAIFTHFRALAIHGEDCTSRETGTRTWRKSVTPYHGRKRAGCDFFAGRAEEEDGGVFNYFQPSYCRLITIGEAVTSLEEIRQQNNEVQTR